MRNLVTIRTIDEIQPIEGADIIEVAIIGGWKSIVKKEYKLQPGDLCVYSEIDSFLPLQERYEFLRQSSFKRMEGLEGFRLRTMKMRGVVSQGLALPFYMFPEVEEELAKINSQASTDEIYEYMQSLDWTEILGVLKYEPYISPENIGKIRGSYPNFIRKTDQERCQNIVGNIFGNRLETRYEITLKLDGTSFTGFYVNGIEGVCSRNNELDVTDAGNKYVTMYQKSGLKEALRLLGKNYAVQGELMGPAIQNNREGLISHKLYIFDIYDIDAAAQLSPYARRKFCNDLWCNGVNPDMVLHTPFINTDTTLAELGIFNIQNLLAYAEGPSLNHTSREGLVFKSVDGQYTFKAISNQFLLKQKD